MPEERQLDSVHGYSLFNDIKDKKLQSRNRAMVLANIIEDNLYDKSGVVTQAGMMYSLAYWGQIADEDRDGIYSQLKDEVASRNLIVGGV